MDTWPIDKLRNWEKNPRAINKEDYERLKRQIEDLGQYKPLIITPDGEVLGGNMRLRAYQDLGIKDIWVSVVKPKDEAEKLKYALSDNDRAGYYVEQELAELLEANKVNINLEDYKVDVGRSIDLKELLENYMTVDEKEVDENIETDNKCPRCGYEY